MAKPVRPEPKFFLRENCFEIGKSGYLSTYYKEATENQVLGEKSTSYIESENAARNIQAMFPKANILIVLRNPVERAISNYFFSKQHGLETRALEEVFIDKKEAPKLPNDLSVNPFDYLERGKYDVHLNRYLETFNSKQIYVIVLEELISNTTKEVKLLYDFLSVDNSHQLENANEIANPSDKLEDVSQEIRNVLKEFFTPTVKVLAQTLKRDLSIWDS